MDADAPLHRLAVDAHASRTPDAPALVAHDAHGARSTLTFGEVADLSRRLAAYLAREGRIERGDRVAVVLPQSPETALLHVALSRLGAISTPLSPLFGADGLAVRLADAQPKLVLTHAPRAGVVREALAEARLAAPLRLVDDETFDRAWRAEPPLATREEANVSGDDPCLLIYTSGTTGGPKGALLPHRVLPGRMPGLLLAHEPLVTAESPTVFYSPADWSWIGGLLDSLLAPWVAGASVLAVERHGPFEPAAVWHLLADERVTNAFFPPTALKALRRAGDAPRLAALSAVHSAGEPLAVPTLRWARERLAPVVTEVYGLTEAAFLIGSAARAYATTEGAIGRVYPGHRVAIDDAEVCVERGDPTLMLGYWRGEGNAPHLPLDAEGRFRTGDLATLDPAGDFHYVGRRDDLIKTSGYRVGPAEVEASLLAHPAVVECAVIGVPDAERGERIKAFVKLAPATRASGEIERALAAHVRDRLGAHAYPREFAFVDALPMTVSGKIRRRELRERESRPPT